MVTPPDDDEFEDEDEDDDDEESEDDESEDDDDEELDPDEVEELEHLEDDEVEEEEPPPLLGEELQSELFRSAVQSLQEAIPAWKQQADLLLGRSVEFVPDFDSLHGQFSLVQPFVHRAIAGTFEALMKIRFGPNPPTALATIERIMVKASPPDQSNCMAAASGSALTINVPLALEEQPGEAIAAAIRAALPGKLNEDAFLN